MIGLTMSSRDLSNETAACVMDGVVVLVWKHDVRHADHRHRRSNQLQRRLTSALHLLFHSQLLSVVVAVAVLARKLFALGSHTISIILVSRNLKTQQHISRALAFSQLLSTNMPLGLAKDSFLDLAALAESKNESKLALDGDIPSETSVPLSLGEDDDDQQQQLSPTSLVEAGDSQFESDSPGQSSSAAITETAPLMTFDPTTSFEHVNTESTAEPQKRLSSISSSSPNKQQYSGFAADFADYHSHTITYDYAHDPYAPHVLGHGSEGKGLWCCLFPWLNNDAPKRLYDDDENGEEGMEEERQVLVEGKMLSRSSSRDEDEYSTGSEALGEKLTEKDRQAVLARLRLAPPDSTTTESDSVGDQKSLLNGLPAYDENGDSKTMKRASILKRVSLGSNNQLQKGQSQSSLGSDQPSGARRRSLFPVYKTQQNHSNNNVHFAPMARVVTVKSKQDMTEEEKSDIWWQRSDYEDFRKTGRLITKAMLEGGSEIWLASNQSWLTPDNNRAGTLKRAFKMAGGKERSVSVTNPQETAGDKWWHMFGHSRRGLEHIASGEEGRQRQANVKTAIQSVLDEQRRQKMYHREDPEKLRMVSIQHTSWARDLALAAGASDSDAVKSNFDDQRKSREFYLLKLSRANKTTTTQERVIPQFMQPIMAASSQTQQRLLDANTSAQIRFRQKQLGVQSPTLSRADSPMASNSLEPIHDPTPVVDNGESVAKRAAGFSHGPASEKVNMAAVLSGMGAIGAH